jgi:hypothetical protein
MSLIYFLPRSELIKIQKILVCLDPNVEEKVDRSENIDCSLDAANSEEIDVEDLFLEDEGDSLPYPPVSREQLDEDLEYIGLWQRLPYNLRRKYMELSYRELKTILYQDYYDSGESELLETFAKLRTLAAEASPEDKMDLVEQVNSYRSKIKQIFKEGKCEQIAQELTCQLPVGYYLVELLGQPQVTDYKYQKDYDESGFTIHLYCTIEFKHFRAKFHHESRSRYGDEWRDEWQDGWRDLTIESDGWELNLLEESHYVTKSSDDCFRTFCQEIGVKDTDCEKFLDILDYLTYLPSYDSFTGFGFE